MLSGYFFVNRFVKEEMFSIWDFDYVTTWYWLKVSETCKSCLMCRLFFPWFTCLSYYYLFLHRSLAVVNLSTRSNQLTRNSHSNVSSSVVVDTNLMKWKTFEKSSCSWVCRVPSTHPSLLLSVSPLAVFIFLRSATAFVYQLDIITGWLMKRFPYLIHCVVPRHAYGAIWLRKLYDDHDVIFQQYKYHELF